MQQTTLRHLPRPDIQPPSRFIYHTPKIPSDSFATMSSLQTNSEEPMTMKSVLRTFLTERLSAHAFPRIFNSPNSFRQSVWTLVSLTFFGLMLWQVCVTLIQYYNYPKSTQVQIKDNTGLIFPAVTICNLNALKASKALNTTWRSAVLLGRPQRKKRQATTTVQSTVSTETTAGTTTQSAYSSASTTAYSSASSSYSNSYASYNSYYSYSYSSNIYGTQDSYTQAEFYNTTVDDFASIIRAMPTLDGSQMSDVFTPSVEDIVVAGYTAEEFIKSCSFDGEICSFRDFLVWQNQVYGNCFTFNSMFEINEALTGPMKRINFVRRTTRYGAKYGLRLLLDVNESEYIEAVTPNKGARVSVHHPDQVPFPEDNGLNVAGAFRTGVSVSQHWIKRVPAPHGDCISNAKWNEQWPGSYTTEACNNVCLEGRIRRRCNCAGSINSILYKNISEMAHLPRCNPTNKTQDMCLAQTRLDFLYNTEPCDCPAACREISYKHSISFDEPSPQFDNVVQEVKQVTIPLKSLKLHVYYNNLNIQQIKEQPAFSFLTLISNIGGSFGLFVGLSLVTIVEMLEFLFDFTRAFCTCPVKKHKPNLVDPSKTM